MADVAWIGVMYIFVLYDSDKLSLCWDGCGGSDCAGLCGNLSFLVCPELAQYHESFAETASRK